MKIRTDILAELQNNSKEAQEELYHYICSGPIFYWVFRQIGQDASDICHNAYISVLQNIEKENIQKPESFGAYVIQVLRNHILTHIKKVSSTRSKVCEIPDSLCDKTNTETSFFSKETFLLVSKKIRRLKEIDKEIIVRFYLKEESAEDIRNDLNLTYTQFALRKNRALVYLRDLVQRA